MRTPTLRSTALLVLAAAVTMAARRRRPMAAAGAEGLGGIARPVARGGAEDLLSPARLSGSSWSRPSRWSRIPVAIDIDADGRLWVVEMRGYMPDAEARGEREPVGRVVVLEDTDDDGRMDKRTVFLDGLVLPRSIKVLDHGVLDRRAAAICGSPATPTAT